LERVKNSFNSYPLDRAAIAGATASIKDKAYFEETCQKIITTRERITESLEALDFLVLPSKTNFVFAKPKSHDAAQLYQQLKEAGILVRYFSSPRIDGFLRITIGTDSEMDTFLGELEGLL
jgi:histidinol-phosphate aminotransferase